MVAILLCVLACKLWRDPISNVGPRIEDAFSLIPAVNTTHLLTAPCTVSYWLALEMPTQCSCVESGPGLAFDQLGPLNNVVDRQLIENAHNVKVPLRLARYLEISILADFGCSFGLKPLRLLPDLYRIARTFWILPWQNRRTVI
jgi:hypothetical protein